MVAPLVAVTVTLNAPRAEETVSVEVADVAVGDSIMLVELSMVVALPDGTLVTRITVPENPLDPVTVSVEMPEDPELMVKDAGPGVTVKSGVGTVTATVMR